jgi:hypothetical protein
MNLIPAEQFAKELSWFDPSPALITKIRQIQANALRYAADTDSESLRDKANQLDPQPPTS